MLSRRPGFPGGGFAFFRMYNRTMHDCLFCSIAGGDPSKLVWSNEVAAAFKDINPKAPIHILIVTKKHLTNLDELSDPALGGRLLMAVREVAEKVGVKGAYRVQINNGKSAGQVIEHLHIHLLGGKSMTD